MAHPRRVSSRRWLSRSISKILMVLSEEQVWEVFVSRPGELAAVTTMMMAVGDVQRGACRSSPERSHASQTVSTASEGAVLARRELTIMSSWRFDSCVYRWPPHSSVKMAREGALGRYHFENVGEEGFDEARVIIGGGGLEVWVGGELSIM